MLLIALALIFLLVAITRPGPARLRFGRHRPFIHAAPRPPVVEAPDPTLGLRDPARRL
jgi:hypothetical protein